MNRKYPELTSKQEKFVDLYIGGLTPAESYRQAYDTQLEPRFVSVEANKMMKKPKVAHVIANVTGKNNRAKQRELESILDEFGKIAYSNIVDIFDFDIVKNKIMLKGDVKTLSELPREITACIQSLKQTRDGIEVKLYAKDSALSQIARILGFYAPEKIIHAETSLAELLKDD